MNPVAVFVLGFLAGVGLSSIYVASLKATLKVYRYYVRERINGELKPATTPQGHLHHTHAA